MKCAKFEEAERSYLECTLTMLTNILPTFSKSVHKGWFATNVLKYIPDMTFQLPRLLHISFSTFYACQSVLFLYLATSFAKKRAVTKHLTSKFCFVQHFLIKIQLTRFMVKCAKSWGSWKVISGMYFKGPFFLIACPLCKPEQGQMRHDFK